MREKILAADDEPEILNIISRYLTKEGYEVLTAENGLRAMELVESKPDLIILDIMMPGLDGLSVCRSVREVVTCPILFLTARVSEAEKIMGFSAGADDYIVKPFGIQELGARVDAHLRRENRKANISRRKSFGLLWIDYTAHQIGYEDKLIEFARKEYEIVELLSLNSGQIFSRERIYERIWGYDAEGDAGGAVTEHVKRIRQKLGEYGQSGLIETVWGVGYRWRKN
jgi:DNA-binding response OmpR family regulator